MEAQKTQEIKLRKTFTGKNALVNALKEAGFDPKVEKEVFKKAAATQGRSEFGEVAMIEDAVDQYGSSNVYYTYNCDIKLLNKFNPYCSVISDSPFHPAWIFADKIVFQPESRCRRSDIANAQQKLGYSCFGYKR